MWETYFVDIKVYLRKTFLVIIEDEVYRLETIKKID